METSPVRERMKHFIEKYYMLNRVSVSDDTSLFTRELANELGVELLSLPSGTECLTWTVPRKWIVHEAYIETLDGLRLADFAWHPITLKSYSAPFSGIVTREKLLDHIAVHPHLNDRLVYTNRWQYLSEHREWGFSLTANTVNEMKDEVYRVHIDTEFGSGTLDIIDWILPGDSPETIFFAAHTCHPGQVNDGLACIAVLLELFRYLQQLPNRHYTYRLILGPEYYAAAGLLHHGSQVDKLKYGFYLDMMGNSHPISFSRSFAGNSYADQITRNALSHREVGSVEAPYRGLYGNDEMFYDGPGFEIPTICLSRHPFEYYHTDFDDVAHCDFAKLEESLTVLQNIVDVFETDCIPTRTYKGPLYLSKYNLYIDPLKDQKGYNSLQEAQILMNGQRSCMDIAMAIDIDFGFVRNFVNELCKHNLATVRPLNTKPFDKQPPRLEVVL